MNANGSLDTTFDPGSGTSNNVAPIALQADGKIVFGAGADNEVKALVVQPDGRILVGGAFGKFNGVSRVSIARLNSDGTLDTTFDPRTGALFWVNAIALQDDGRILIGGPFTTYNGVARKGIARLLPNGGLDTTFNPGTGANNWVNSVALQSDGKIVVGGIFTNFNGVLANHLVRLNGDGSLDPTFNIGSGLDQTVQKVVAPPDGSIVAGGLFTSVNGVACGRIARFIGLSGSPMPVIDAQAGLAGTLLSWPTYGLGWDIESTVDLSTPFSPSGLTTGTTNGISFSTISAGSGQLFLRLKRNP